MTKKRSGKKSTIKQVEFIRPSKQLQKPAEAAAEHAETNQVSLAEHSTQESVDGLRTWNRLLAVMFAVQAVAILVFSLHAGKSFPIVANFLVKDPLQTAAQGSSVFLSAVHHLFDVNVAYVVETMLGVSALLHALVATKLRRRYEAYLAARRNPLRWASAAITGSLAMLTLALLVGVQDIGLLLAISALTVLASCLLVAFENSSAASKSIRLMVFAKLAGFLPWVILVLYLIFGGLYGSAVPAYEYWLIGSLYVCFALEAASVWQQYKAKGRWLNFGYVERVFLIISLVSQTLLAWQVFAGAL